jgi:hypothetical protein
MNEKLKHLSLMAGGSYYPSINPDMQQAFADLIIQECIKAVQDTDTRHAVTTYDQALINTTIHRSVESIKKTFGV